MLEKLLKAYRTRDFFKILSDATTLELRLALSMKEYLPLWEASSKNSILRQYNIIEVDQARQFIRDELISRGC